MQRMPILNDSDMSLFELKTRYVRNYLTFAGKNSKDFLLYLSAPGVYGSPEVDISVPTGELECLRLSVRRSSADTSRALAMDINVSRLGALLPDSI